MIIANFILFVIFSLACFFKVFDELSRCNEFKFFVYIILLIVCVGISSCLYDVSIIKFEKIDEQRYCDSYKPDTNFYLIRVDNKFKLIIDPIDISMDHCSASNILYKNLSGYIKITPQ